MIKLLTAAALLGTQAASPPPGPPAPRCLTRQQVGDLSVVGTAIFVEGARNACRPHLPPTAFLLQPAGAEYAGRLRVEGRRRFNSAVDGISQVTGGSAPAQASLFRTFVDSLLAEGAGAEFSNIVDRPMCRDANEMIEILSATSPDQIARFSAAMMSLGSRFAERGPPRMGPMNAPPPPAPPGPPAPRPIPASADTGAQDPPVPVMITPPRGARPAPPPRPRSPIVCPE